MHSVGLKKIIERVSKSTEAVMETFQPTEKRDG